MAKFELPDSIVADIGFLLDDIIELECVKDDAGEDGCNHCLAVRIANAIDEAERGPVVG